MESKDVFRDLMFDGKPGGYRDFRRRVILGVASLEDKTISAGRTPSPTEATR